MSVSIQSVLDYVSSLEDDIKELWYFIIATIVLTAVGIISVLMYLGV